MTERTVRRLATRALFACVFSTLVCVRAIAQCVAPRYRIGANYIGPTSGRGALQLSVRRKDLPLNRLVCLVESLRRHNAGWTDVVINFFTSHDAAKYFNPSGIDNPGLYKWGRHFRASYDFEEDKHEEYLIIMPLGFNESYYATRINLPLRGKPECRLAAAGRCLLAADDIVYPGAQASGRVVLTGTIRRDGRVTGLRAAEADVNPSTGRNVLAKSALKSLRSWQFDASEHDDPIRLTFSYVIDTSRPHAAPPEVHWALPNQVTIRGNPTE